MSESNGQSPTPAKDPTPAPLPVGEPQRQQKEPLQDTQASPVMKPSDFPLGPNGR
jgi:hypothetical protein